MASLQTKEKAPTKKARLKRYKTLNPPMPDPPEEVFRAMFRQADRNLARKRKAR